MYCETGDSGHIDRADVKRDSTSDISANDFNKITNSFLFSYIRDPVDRLISSYFELKRRKHAFFNQFKMGKNNGNVAPIVEFRWMIKKLYRLFQMQFNNNVM